jgi:hypothetical protein
MNSFDMLGGLAVIVRTPFEQKRTPLIGGDWFHPKVPPKSERGKVSRKTWLNRSRKRGLKSRQTFVYSEPTDILQFNGKIVVTPNQLKMIQERS